jgi:hypothetical protein
MEIPMDATCTKASEKAQQWRIVLEHLRTCRATTRDKALGTAAIKTALRMPHPDFEGMWKRGFIEWFQPEGSKLWHCYAVVEQLPADPVAAPLLRDYDEQTKATSHSQDMA